MARVTIKIPGFQEFDGETPIVILGPNGSGKTQLAQRIAQNNSVDAISAQRRTWVDDNLPVQEDEQLRNNVRSQQNQWQQHAWQPTEDINFLLSTLIQEHTSLLTKKNEEAIALGVKNEPVKDTKLILLQGLWSRVFPKRKLEFGGFFPKVKRTDRNDAEKPYQLRQMSDGERTILYMAARVMTSEQPVILVDEPELHMHSRLAIKFWDEAEKLRPDCRFIYITHDLNFTLSRRRATFLVTKASDIADVVLSDELPTSVAGDILGAATLPFYAKRIFFFEGELGAGFASKFFAAWFDTEETFAIPGGDRNSVCAAVSGLKQVGVVAAEVFGLIDRDFYSNDVLNATTDGVTVLPLHEIESVLCDRKIVTALAQHLGKNPESIWSSFLERVRREYRGNLLNNIVAKRVRSRVGDLLHGAFSGSQIAATLAQTSENHSIKLSELDLPNKILAMFTEEEDLVTDALAGGEEKMLAILPGKHLLSILAPILGFSGADELAALVIQSLNRKPQEGDNPFSILGRKVEEALLSYLPPR